MLGGLGSRLLNGVSGPRAGLPGPILERFWPDAYCERTKNRHQHTLFARLWMSMALNGNKREQELVAQGPDDKDALQEGCDMQCAVLEEARLWAR